MITETIESLNLNYITICDAIKNSFEKYFAKSYDSCRA